MNYRVVVTADRCAIVKTGAAADDRHIFATLANARQHLSSEIAWKISQFRIARDELLSIRDRDLPVAPTPEGGLQRTGAAGQAVWVQQDRVFVQSADGGTVEWCEPNDPTSFNPGPARDGAATDCVRPGGCFTPQACREAGHCEKAASGTASPAPAASSEPAHEGFRTMAPAETRERPVQLGPDESAAPAAPSPAPLVPRYEGLIERLDYPPPRQPTQPHPATPAVRSQKGEGGGGLDMPAQLDRRAK